MAGTIMDRLDHVLMTFLVPFSFWPSTFFCRWSSTKGPFFRERGMVPGLRSALLAGLAAADDHRVAGLVRPAGAPLALALPAHAAGLAPVDVGLLGVADLADRGAAAGVDVADLARGHPQLGVRPV